MKNSDNILVVKSNLALSPQSLDTMRKGLLKQKKEGVIVVPYFCDALIIPNDAEVKVKEGVMMDGD